MTNYEHTLNLLSKNKSLLASFMSVSCSNCPHRLTMNCIHKDKDKSCYTLVLEWLNEEWENNEYDE